MKDMTPEDVMRLADEQKRNAKLILAGKLPPPNEMLKRMAQQYQDIGHDLELIDARLQQQSRTIEQLRETKIKLIGAAEGLERNVALVQWFDEVKAPPPGALAPVKAEEAP